MRHDQTPKVDETDPWYSADKFTGSYPTPQAPPRAAPVFPLRTFAVGIGLGLGCWAVIGYAVAILF